jgi:hypothetical protein
MSDQPQSEPGTQRYGSATEVQLAHAQALKSNIPSVLRSLGMRVSSIFPRGLFGRMFGTGYGGKRDYYEVFGWDRFIDARDTWSMYKRGGIAKRVVHAYPDEVWGNPPEIKATQAWTNAWETLITDRQIWSYILKCDILTQIDKYSILFVGTDATRRLDIPLKDGAATSRVWDPTLQILRDLLGSYYP